MSKQEIQLFSDATFIENSPHADISACGSCIIRSIDVDNNGAYSSRKRIHIYNSINSAHAELYIGLLAMSEICENFEASEVRSCVEELVINWFCDLPYLSDLIKSDKETSSSLSPLVQKIREIGEKYTLIIKTPTSSDQIKYHSLCHRACTMTREAVLPFLEDAGLDSVGIREKLMEIFFRKNSNWEI